MLSDSISDRTIALLLPCLWICTSKTNVPADLYELLSVAKNLSELIIRIFQSAYFLCPGYEIEDIKVALSELN